jgi:hypothetical protein
MVLLPIGVASGMLRGLETAGGTVAVVPRLRAVWPGVPRVNVFRRVLLDPRLSFDAEFTLLIVTTGSISGQRNFLNEIFKNTLTSLKNLPGGTLLAATAANAAIGLLAGSALLAGNDLRFLVALDITFWI